MKLNLFIYLNIIIIIIIIFNWSKYYYISWYLFRSETKIDVDYWYVIMELMILISGTVTRMHL